MKPVIRRVKRLTAIWATCCLPFMKTQLPAVIDFEMKSHEFHMASFANAFCEQALHKQETKQVCTKISKLLVSLIGFAIAWWFLKSKWSNVCERMKRSYLSRYVPSDACKLIDWVRKIILFCFTQQTHKHKWEKRWTSPGKKR